MIFSGLQGNSESMKFVTVVQARRGSSRLPDKVLMALEGETVLTRMVERVLAAKKSGTVVVATTTDQTDDAIEALCDSHGFNCFRGHPTDLLDRHVEAARPFHPDAVVKIPSDCPLIDPAVIDRVITEFEEAPCDYLGNLHPATYPDGQDVEIMAWSAITRAQREALRPLEREHTTPYFWENPNLFNCKNSKWETGLNYSMSHRWTLDYKEDYDFLLAVYGELYKVNPLFGIADILKLLDARPDIFEINSKYAGVNWYRNHLGELKTIASHETKILKT